METRTPEAERELFLRHQLTEWARGHTNRHSDLVLMNGVAHESTEQTQIAQHPDAKHIAGSPLDGQTIETFVTVIEPRFPQMLDTLELHEQQSGYITTLGHKLEEGKNIIVATNHEKMPDLGYVLAAFYVALKNKGFEFHTGTIVGKIAPYLGRRAGENVMSLTDVLTLGCNDVYLGYPDTQSTVEAGIPEDTANEHNMGMLKVLLRNLRRGGNLLVIDPTGTTNKPSPEGLVTFGAVSSATEGILRKNSSLVVPAGIWLEEGSSTVVFTTDGKLYRISDEIGKKNNAAQSIGMNSFMDHLAHLLNEAVDPAVMHFENPSTKTHDSLGSIVTKASLS